MNEILVLIGKSGCGKDTLATYLLDNGYSKIVSYTNRPVREGEIHGKDYMFCSKEEAISYVDNKVFFQHRMYKTLLNGEEDIWYYGTRREDILDDKKYVVIVDNGGAESYLEEFSDRVKIIYVKVPDEIREERAKLRGSFCQIEWDRRLLDDNIKFEYITEQLNCKVIDNSGSLEDSLKQIKEIL